MGLQLKREVCIGFYRFGKLSKYRDRIWRYAQRLNLPETAWALTEKKEQAVEEVLVNTELKMSVWRARESNVAKTEVRGEFPGQVSGEPYQPLRARGHMLEKHRSGTDFILRKSILLLKRQYHFSGWGRISAIMIRWRTMEYEARGSDCM